MHLLKAKDITCPIFIHLGNMRKVLAKNFPIMNMLSAIISLRLNIIAKFKLIIKRDTHFVNLGLTNPKSGLQNDIK